MWRSAGLSQPGLRAATPRGEMLPCGLRAILSVSAVVMCVSSMIARVSGGNPAESSERRADGTHIKIFSFYGDDPARQVGIVNARMWDKWPAPKSGNPYWDMDETFRSSGMGSFMQVDALLWLRAGCNLTGVGCPSLNASLCGLKPDWAASLTHAVRSAQPQLRSGAMVGIFLGDEIQCGGISASNVSAVAALSKRLLKENGGGARAKVWVNECVDPFLPAPTWCAETHPIYGSCF